MRKSRIPSVAPKKYRDLKECAKIGIALAKVGRGNMWEAGEWYIDAREQFVYPPSPGWLRGQGGRATATIRWKPTHQSHGNSHRS